MADECTMSIVTMLNTAQNQLKVQTIIAMTQVRGYYKNKQPVHATSHIP
jgi:hypothetical protein